MIATGTALLVFAVVIAVVACVVGFRQTLNGMVLIITVAYFADLAIGMAAIKLLGGY